MWLKLALPFLFLTVAPVAQAQVGALQTDCKLGGMQRDGSYQFIPTCAGRAISPDGRFAIVQKSYDDDQPPIEFQNGRSKVLMKVHNLSDDMPFSVLWSPDSRWLMVNHHVGSFMDVLQIFEIVHSRAIERTALIKAVQREAVRRYPCLPLDMVLPNGIKWSRDSRRVALYTVSRPDTCTEWSKKKGTFKALLMVGNITTGKIETATVRILPDDGKTIQIPKSSAYAGFE